MLRRRDAIRKWQGGQTPLTSDNGLDNEHADLSNVWGDCNCYKLFDTNLDGASYDAAVPSSKEDWPCLNVCSNCHMYKVFVVDQFSM